MIELFDPNSLAVVGGGTLLATLVHCGPKACRLTVAVLLSAATHKFDFVKARAEVSRQIADIEQDGLVRSDPNPIGDQEIDDATAALVKSRSLAGLSSEHDRHRRQRLQRSQIAQSVLLKAAELGPILGLAGTLLALAGLVSPDTTASSSIANAIGTAVLTTLYGLLLSNFVFAPLASLVDRKARNEDLAREELFAWMEAKILEADPRTRRPLEVAR